MPALALPASAQTDPDQASSPPPVPLSGSVSATPAMQAAGSAMMVVPHASNKICGYALAAKFLIEDAGAQRFYVGGVQSGRQPAMIAIDLTSGALRPIPIGNASALAVDPEDNKIFVALSDLPQIEVLDRRSLQRIDRIMLNDPVSTLSYDSRSHLLIAGAARQALAWIVDAKQHVVVDSIVLSGVASANIYDNIARRAYLTIQTANAIDVVDPDARSVASLWQLPPMLDPQAAVLTGSRVLVAAGADGHLASLLATSGKLAGTSSVPAGPGILSDADFLDQVVYDSPAAGSAGVYSIGAAGLPVFIGSFTIPMEADAAAIISSQGAPANYYVAYTSGDGTYLERFTLPDPK